MGRAPRGMAVVQVTQPLLSQGNSRSLCAFSSSVTSSLVPGRTIVHERLPELQKQHSVDLTIANGENSAGGFGITPQIAEELFELGIDVITTGNHVWDKREIIDYMNSANGNESFAGAPRCCGRRIIPRGRRALAGTRDERAAALSTPSSICRAASSWPTTTTLSALPTIC